MNRSLHRHWLTLTMLMTLLMILGVAALLIMWIGETSTTSSPAGQRAELVTSPSGRFRARLWRCCDITANTISGFRIEDTETRRVYRQNLADVPELHSAAGGTFFAWTPGEAYFVLVTDVTGTSHGCDDLLVYAGDGSALIYNSAPTNLCRSIGAADLSIEIVELAHGHIVYATYPSGCYRLDLSQNEVIELSPDECADR
jgi:hypothetical protein